MKKDTWKDIVKFMLLCAVLGAMFTYTAINEVNASAFILNEGTAAQSLKSLGTYTITAYCPCKKCCGKSDGITASGAKAKANHTIAAPKGFDFGTKLIINGIEYVVEDRGGSVKGKRLDIYFSNHSEAKKWGKRKCEVFCYE